jgi:hypothetical protein
LSALFYFVLSVPKYIKFFLYKLSKALPIFELTTRVKDGSELLWTAFWLAKSGNEQPDATAENGGAEQNQIF